MYPTCHRKSIYPVYSERKKVNSNAARVFRMPPVVPTDRGPGVVRGWPGGGLSHFAVQTNKAVALGIDYNICIVLYLLFVHLVCVPVLPKI